MLGRAQVQPVVHDLLLADAGLIYPRSFRNSVSRTGYRARTLLTTFPSRCRGRDAHLVRAAGRPLKNQDICITTAPLIELGFFDADF